MPGRVMTGVRCAPSSPLPCGIPGRIATLTNSTPPSADSTSLTVSYTPIDTPPLVMTRSGEPGGASTRARTASSWPSRKSASSRPTKRRRAAVAAAVRSVVEFTMVSPPYAAGPTPRATVGRRGDREVPRGEPGAGAEHHRAGGDVLTAAADVAPGIRLEEQRDLPRPTVGELDRHHGVTALGQRRTGHDPHRVAGREDVAGRVAGGDVSADGQDDRVLAARTGELTGPHGVAVHRRVVEPGQVDQGRDVLGQHQPQRSRHGHPGGG